MKYSYKVEAVAVEQLLDAADWYDEQSIGLGERLIFHFEAAIESLCKNPNYEIRYRELRVFNLKVFPYQIVYFISGNEIIIVAFLHGHRDPEIWKKK